MNVLSLCDGMSCALIALNKLGIKVENYFSSEIKGTALKLQKHNFLEENAKYKEYCSNFIQIGDVNKVSYSNGTLTWEGGSASVGIDLVCFGSPCQTFSIAIPADKRIGLDNKVKSGLFFECKRVLDEVKPEYFLMENVYSMKKEDVKTVTEIMGVKPIMLDGADYSAAIRKRWYWTNIPFTKTEVTAPCLQDILTSGWTERQKARCLAVIDSRPNSTPKKMFFRYYSTGFTTLIWKSKEHYEQCVAYFNSTYGGKRKVTAHDLDNDTSTVFNGVRYMNKAEREKCQSVPQGYTDCLTENEAADLLGDGWQCDVIADIFKGMQK